MPNKHEMTVKELRLFITKKGIKLQSGYIKKQDLINILNNILSVNKNYNHYSEKSSNNNKKIRFNPDIKIIYF